jgi:hypothetical protein
MDKTALAILAGGAWLTATPAYAYIDPGTGGLLVQLLTGGVAGALVLLKLYWHKVRDLFGLSAPDAGPASPATGSASLPNDEQG